MKFIHTARPLIFPVIIPIPLGGFSVAAPHAWRIVLKLLGLPYNLICRIVSKFQKKNRPDRGGTRTSQSESRVGSAIWSGFVGFLRFFRLLM